jgi:hypothetical protein
MLRSRPRARRTSTAHLTAEFEAMALCLRHSRGVRASLRKCRVAGGGRTLRLPQIPA